MYTYIYIYIYTYIYIYIYICTYKASGSNYSNVFIEVYFYGFFQTDLTIEEMNNPLKFSRN